MVADAGQLLRATVSYDDAVGFGDGEERSV